MDITRNWRLKISRSQLLATRSPETGDVLLPQQTGSVARSDQSEVYTFTTEPDRVAEAEIDYARAAR